MGAKGCRIARGLLLNVVVEPIEMGEAIGAVAEETGAHALPITIAHGERFTNGYELATVGAILELIVAVVDGEAEPCFRNVLFIDDTALAITLYIESLWTKTDGPKLLAYTDEACRGVSGGGKHGGSGAAIAHGLLCEHVATGLEVSRGQGFECQEASFLL